MSHSWLLAELCESQCEEAEAWLHAALPASGMHTWAVLHVCTRDSSVKLCWNSCTYIKPSRCKTAELWEDWFAALPVMDGTGSHLADLLWLGLVAKI